MLALHVINLGAILSIVGSRPGGPRHCWVVQVTHHNARVSPRSNKGLTLAGLVAREVLQASGAQFGLLPSSRKKKENRKEAVEGRRREEWGGEEREMNSYPYQNYHLVNAHIKIVNNYQILLQIRQYCIIQSDIW